MGVHVKGLSDMPRGEHWAILTFRTILVPGDRRSIEAPGHGYPEHEEPAMDYEVFSSEAEFMDAMRKFERSPSDYYRMRTVGIHVVDTYRAETRFVADVVKEAPGDFRT